MAHESSSVFLEESTITPKEYNALRKAIGWHTFSEERAGLALSNSVYVIKAVLNSDVIGMGRIVGDGTIYFYIHDVMVLKDYQGRGVGTLIMNKLMKKIHAITPEDSGAFIGLMISPGLQKFYSNFGFTKYPEDSPGMCIWKTNIHNRIK